MQYDINTELTAKAVMLMQLDDYLTSCVAYNVATKQFMLKTRQTIRKIIRLQFPVKKYRTLVETYIVNGVFHLMIAFRQFSAPKFTIINMQM